MTINPFKWAKYTKIISSAEKKFADIYNFEVVNEHKTIELITPLAFTIILEEARINKLNPDELEDMLYPLSSNSPFTRFVMPVGNKLVDWLMYKKLYTYYVNTRATNYRPIVSMFISMDLMERNITKDEAELYKYEYEAKPIFGQKV